MYICLVVLNHFGVIKPVLKFRKTWIPELEGQCEWRYAHIWSPMMRNSRVGGGGMLVFTL